MNNHEMTDEEIYAELEAEEERFAESVWDSIQKGEYIVEAGAVFSRSTGEFVCNLSVIR